ncbi:S-methyl-5-thioribose-1-phosphate isomerase [Patescibacteria group bacterium]|nr:S-methyl-5-thioribose-1-phosphate isomerase [Patescibacteria group bacterium]MBU1673698.1 S-methyl-5-thioribose-1-phosphate isomerase [Patescibacteria group bacterium]MBU1963073.1 S-methyl-5-thioribose-1-phosphate isomerase [Patescibacteria group bacterium]
MIVNGKHYRTVWWQANKVKMIEQNMLPNRFKIVTYTKYKQVCNAIYTMVTRGAGAIGGTAGYGMALAAVNAPDKNFYKFMQKAKKDIEATRPTAQNLFYATNLVFEAIKDYKNDPKKAREVALEVAEDIAQEDSDSCERIGRHGSKLIKSGYNISTHCNAGWLAFVDWGSALSPIYWAKMKQKKKVFVYADETRPRLQGAKLTAWELFHNKIPHKIVCDNTTGALMQRGLIDMCIVGSDRIARNGDVANKIGTYTLATMAKAHGVPFYVAAPTSTIDITCKSGKDIPIEERDEKEVLEIDGIRIANHGSHAVNIAFDVTPAKLVAGIITEQGIIKPSWKKIQALNLQPVS